ncbi:MAG: SGNH/GDSL hydrolase family protein [Chloroflexota bacterium]
MKRVLILICIWMTACASSPTPLPVPAPQAVPTLTRSPITTDRTPPSTPILTNTPSIRFSASPSVTSSATRPASPAIKITSIDPADWKAWPVIPEVDPSIRALYEYGQSLGNDPHAFSIFGDCQSRPDAFLGVFETDPDAVKNLSPELQEVVVNFSDSLNRESPTSQDGTTPGALLWDQWHRGEYGCTFDETPVQCELRIHRPSFVLIQIGTHFESRNTEYLRKIITQLIDAGVVPILATKADNRELDDRINRDMALLASEYDLPLWNFWAALSDLPDRGLYVMEGREQQGAIYLNEEASTRHRMTGLEALDVVWRVATGK